MDTVAPWRALRVLALVTVPAIEPVDDDCARADETPSVARRTKRLVDWRHSRVIRAQQRLALE
jgi:hypothetical protein